MAYKLLNLYAEHLCPQGATGEKLFFEEFLCSSSLSGLSRTDNKTHLPPEISGKGDFGDMSFNHDLDYLYCFKGKIKAFFDNALNLPWQI